MIEEGRSEIGGGDPHVKGVVEDSGGEWRKRAAGEARSAKRRATSFFSRFEMQQTSSNNAIELGLG